MTPASVAGLLYALEAPLLDGCDVVNLAGDYGYLGAGYYASLDAETRGERVAPTTAEALDAQVAPIALAKAARAGIDVPEHDLVTERFPEPPFLAYPVNPFSRKGELIPDRDTLEARRRGLTYTGKYAVLVQRLPADCRVDVVRIVMGRTRVPEYERFARRLFEAFRLPLMRARVIVAPEAYLLSAIDPLLPGELSPEERGLLEGVAGWPS